MSAEITNLNGRRKPVVYTITITHHWDDTLEVFLEGVSDDERSQEAIKDTLSRVAEAYSKVGGDAP